MARKEDADCRERLSRAVDAMTENQSTDHDDSYCREQLKAVGYKGSMTRCDPNKGEETADCGDCD